MSEAEHLHRHLVAQQGLRLSLNTPALVLDLDMLDRNVAKDTQVGRRGTSLDGSRCGRDLLRQAG
jgi:hypothetical protein